MALDGMHGDHFPNRPFGKLLRQGRRHSRDMQYHRGMHRWQGRVLLQHIRHVHHRALDKTVGRPRAQMDQAEVVAVEDLLPQYRQHKLVAKN